MRRGPLAPELLKSIEVLTSDECLNELDLPYHLIIYSRQVYKDYLAFLSNFLAASTQSPTSEPVPILKARSAEVELLIQDQEASLRRHAAAVLHPKKNKTKWQDELGLFALNHLVGTSVLHRAVSKLRESSRNRDHQMCSVVTKGSLNALHALHASNLCR